MLDKLINSIDESINESSYYVCESIMDMINKYEYANDHNINGTVSSIILETMLVFMESKNRERDATPRNEISKWMEEKKYWYTGNNPKKIKERNRMYHFLQQHKFDPKDETYETSETDANGNPIRLKLHIDPISDLDENGYSVLDDQEQADSIRRGNGSVYGGDDAVYTGSKILKGKQPLSQFVTKHEEGHDDDNRARRDESHKKDKVELNNEFEDFKQKHIDAAGKSLELNEHDNDINEVYADRYAINHAGIRTKNWGTNKETRKLNNKDIQKIFDNISRWSVKETYTLEAYVKKVDKIKTLMRKIRNNKINTYITHRVVITDLKQVKTEYKELMDFVFDIQATKINLDRVKEDATLKSVYTKKLNNLESMINEYDEVVKHISPKDMDYLKKIADLDASLEKAGSYMKENDETKALQETPEFKRALEDYKDRLTKALEKAEKKLDEVSEWAKKGLKILKSPEFKLDESSQFRADLNKTFVKEYFEEFFVL